MEKEQSKMNEIPHPGFEKPEKYETFTTTNDLEEASEKSLRLAGFHNMETRGMDWKGGFIAGANWDREQMMKEAVEAEYGYFSNASKTILPSGKLNIKEGDKVRIIIVKL